jgi:DNA gyrase/topoisomerase IV subunit B
MNPLNCLLLQVTVDEAAEADLTFDMRMGDAVDSFKRFILTHAEEDGIPDIVSTLHKESV